MVKSIDKLDVIVNAEAYNHGRIRIYVTDKGNVYTLLDEIPKGEKVIKTMSRTDDNFQPFEPSNLQTHNTPTSLDITSYNVYPQDGSKSEKPEEVIVGVAGSGDSSDWYQNLLKIDVRNPIN